jgi:hypothetical protein
MVFDFVPPLGDDIIYIPDMLHLVYQSVLEGVQTPGEENESGVGI